MYAYGTLLGCDCVLSERSSMQSDISLALVSSENGSELFGMDEGEEPGHGIDSSEYYSTNCSSASVSGYSALDVRNVVIEDD